MSESLKAGIVPLARGMYNAYGEEAKWLTYDNRPMPAWDALSGEVQMRWIAAAEYARAECTPMVELTVQEYGLVNVSKQVATIYPDVPVMGSHMYKLLYKIAQAVNLKVR